MEELGLTAGLNCDTCAGGKVSRLSSTYSFIPMPIWRRLLMHLAMCARCLAWLSAGKSIDARIAIMAITTNSSINVKAGSSFGFVFIIVLFVTEFSSEFCRPHGFHGQESRRLLTRSEHFKELRD